MLLTLTARSLRRYLSPGSRERIEMEDLPRYVFDNLGLRGLIVETALLKAWSLDRLDVLRTRADQAGCPCLVLRESKLVNLRSNSPAAIEEAFGRLDIVARAAHRLGCNALAVGFKNIKGDAEIEAAALLLRRVMDRIDRMELQLLVEPSGSVLIDPDALINLIKKVGGFRIGTLPSFATAADSGDATSALRQTSPYAGAVLATCGRDAIEGKPSDDLSAAPGESVDLTGCLDAIVSVGYEQVLAIDYVGSDDPIAGIEKARATIESALEKE